MGAGRGLMDEIILELKRRGIHCIIVDSCIEAKNFIMYHIGVGTLVNVEDIDEVRRLELDRSVNENGGILVYGFDNKESEIKEGKKLIDNVEVHGRDYILNNMEQILLGEKQLRKFTYKRKSIVIIILRGMTPEDFLTSIFDEIKALELRCLSTCLVNDDISLILVRENFN